MGRQKIVFIILAVIVVLATGLYYYPDFYKAQNLGDDTRIDNNADEGIVYVLKDDLLYSKEDKPFNVVSCCEIPFLYIDSEEKYVYRKDYSYDESSEYVRLILTEFDASTFDFVITSGGEGGGAGLFKDKNGVYKLISRNREPFFYRFPNSDGSSLKKLGWSDEGNAEFLYLSDKNNVYFKDQIIEDADPESFYLFDYGLYAKDNSSVFYRGVQVEGVDLESFEIDPFDPKNNMYYQNAHDRYGDIVGGKRVSK